MFSAPAYASSGPHGALDTALRPSSTPGQTFAAEQAVLPIHIGGSADHIFDIQLPDGPITVSSPTMTIGHPTASGHEATFVAVAPDTDLVFDVVPSGLKERIVLKSPRAPTSFVFHVSDPGRQLGSAIADSDGSVKFSRPLPDGSVIRIPPAVASDARSAALSSTGASLGIAPAGDGFDVTVRINTSWLKGRTWPVILDPTITISPDNYSLLSGYNFQSPSATNPGSSATYFSDDLYVGNYLDPSSGADWRPMRSFFRFDLSSIPTGSQVSAASLSMWLDGCLDQPNSFPCATNGPYVVDLHPLTAAWDPAMTWNQLYQITDSGAPIASASIPSYSTVPALTAGNAISWTLTSAVQGWLAAGGSNYGFDAQLRTEAGNVGGPRFCFMAGLGCTVGSSATDFMPQLTVTYSPPPGAPQSVSAQLSADGTAATVTWQAPTPNHGAAPSSYTIGAYDGNSNLVGTAQTCNVPCSSVTVGGLVPASTYRFGVRASNAVGMGPISYSSSVNMPITLSASASPQQGTYARGQVVTISATVNNFSATSPTSVSSLSHQWPSGLYLLGTSATVSVNGGSAVACGPSSSPSCTVSGASLTSGTFTLSPGGSLTLTGQATVLGSEVGCARLAATATASTTTGSISAPSIGLTAGSCESGLGVEAWRSDVVRSLGPQALAQIDVASGNLMVATTDGTPVQAHGQLSLGLHRAYNSQDIGLRPVPNPSGGSAQGQVPGSFAPGWTLSVASFGDPANNDWAPAGLFVPAEEAPALAHAVTLIDSTGGRLVFQPRSTAGLPLDLTSSPTDSRQVLSPRVVSLDSGYQHLCADAVYAPPPGVHLSIWRYLETTGSSCSAPPAAVQILGFAAERPDGIRYEFGWDGHLLDIEDPSGVELRIGYENGVYGSRANFGRPTVVFEPSCPASDSKCRVTRITYPASNQISIVDAAGRSFLYTLDAQSRLTTMVAPAFGNFTWAYGYGPAGLIKVTDPRGNSSSIAYDSANPGPRVTAFTDRVGSAANPSYSTSIAYDPANSQTTSTLGNEFQQFKKIDGSGRVGELAEGDSGTSTIYHQTEYFWDAASSGAPYSTCRVTDSAVDNNLCRIWRRSWTTAPGTMTTPTTPDEDTVFKYDDQGRAVLKQMRTATSSVIVSTYGYDTTYARSDGSVNVRHITVAGSGNLTVPNIAWDGSTLFAVEDLKQSLTPRGNSADGGFAGYLTSFTVDRTANLAHINTAPATNPCASGSPALDTGRVCQRTTPPYDGTNTVAVTKYTYNASGQPVTMTDARNQTTSYTYYLDRSASDQDWSNDLYAGGWLKGVADPTGNYVAFAYDRAGNVQRAWDRDATAAWSGLGQLVPPTAPAGAYIETLRRASSSPWLFITSTADQLSDLTTYSLDANGNRVQITPPRGQSAGAQYGTQQTFDANDRVLTTLQPEESGSNASTHYSYDAFGNVVTITDPLGKVVARNFDAVNRLQASYFTLGAATTYGSSPAACFTSGSSGTAAPSSIPAGLVTCEQSYAYDMVDNLVSQTDGSGATTNYGYDGVHRRIERDSPRSATLILKTRYNFDADGNATDVCPPAQDSQTPGSCAANAQFATHYAYDANDRVTAATTYRNSAAYTATHTYDALGNLLSAVDANQHSTTYTYDPQGRRASSIVQQNGAPLATRYSYSNAGDLIATQDPTGVYTDFGYDAAHRRTDTIAGASAALASQAGLVDPNGGQNVHTRDDYDADGNLIHHYAANAFVSSGAVDRTYMTGYVFNRDGNQTGTWRPRYGTVGDVTAASNSDVIFAGVAGGDSQTGQCGAPPPAPSSDSNLTYPAGVGVCITAIARDTAGRVSQVTLPTNVPGGATPNRYRTYSYTDNGWFRSETKPDPSSTGRVSVTYWYDGAGRPVLYQNELGDQRSWQYSYDGLLIEIDGTPGTSQPGTVNHRTTFDYDANANRIGRHDPVANSSTGSPYSQYSYNTDNTLAQIADPLGNVTKYLYDGVGNVVSVNTPNNAAVATTNTYFENNLLRSTVQPVAVGVTRTTSYTYDAAGRKASQTFSTTNQPTVGQQFSYYAAGRLSQIVGASTGGTPNITFQYEPGGRPSLIRESDLSNDYQLSMSYYADGLPRSVMDGDYAVTGMISYYSYDGAGGRVARTDDYAGTSTHYDTRSVRNDAGLVSDVEAPSYMDSAYLGDVSYQYDKAGRLSGQLYHGADASGETIQVGLQWDHDNTLLWHTVGLNASSGYQSINRFSYYSDPDYRVTTQDSSGTGSASGRYRYTYDAAGRLTGFDLGTGTFLAAGHDADGNRTSYSPASSSSTSFTYNSDDSVKTSSSLPGVNFQYASFGGVSNDGCRAYTYDGFDRLTAATPVANNPCGITVQTNYKYDGLGRQIQQWNGTTQTNVEALHFDGLTSTTSFETIPGQWAYGYVVAPDEARLGMSTQPGSPAARIFTFDDGLGVGATSWAPSQGTTTCLVRYNPWGQAISAISGTNPCNTGSTVDNYLYHGARQDTNTSLLQMGDRTYNPATASFTSPDQYLASTAQRDASLGVDPLTLNRYNYVNGDPINLIDPTGHYEVADGGEGGDCTVDSCSSVAGAAAPSVPPLPVVDYSYLSGISAPTTSWPDRIRSTLGQVGPFVAGFGQGLGDATGGRHTGLDLMAALMPPVGAAIGAYGLGSQLASCWQCTLSSAVLTAGDFAGSIQSGWESGSPYERGRALGKATVVGVEVGATVAPGGTAILGAARGASVGLRAAAAAEAGSPTVVAEASGGTMAATDMAKFSNYLFKTPKAPVFTSMGYGPDDALEMSGTYVEQAAAKFESGEYTLGKLDEFGQRVNININMPRLLSDEVRTIQSGWMIRPGGVITLNTPLG